MCHETFDQTIQITMEYNERDVSDDEEIVVEDNNNEDEEPGDELEEEENDKPEEDDDEKVVLNCRKKKQKVYRSSKFPCAKQKYANDSPFVFKSRILVPNSFTF